MRKVWIVEREKVDDKTEIVGVYASLNKAIESQGNVEWGMVAAKEWLGIEADGDMVLERYIITEHKVIDE